MALLWALLNSEENLILEHMELEFTIVNPQRLACQVIG